MSQHRKSTAALTGLLVALVVAGAYRMGRSDERAGRPFALAQAAHAAESPALSPVKALTERYEEIQMPFSIEEMARHFLDAAEKGEVSGSSSSETETEAEAETPASEDPGEAGGEVSAIAV